MLQVSEPLNTHALKCELEDIKPRNENEWKEITVNQSRGSCGWYSRKSVRSIARSPVFSLLE